MRVSGGLTNSDQEVYRKFPSVLMLMSCSTNQMPILSCGSASLEALAARLPIMLRVIMPLWCWTGPCGAVEAGGLGGRPALAGSYTKLIGNWLAYMRLEAGGE
jgi:hypothetical protein